MATVERRSKHPSSDVQLDGAGKGGIEALVPMHERLLTPAACEQLAREIAERGLWQGIELTPTESHTRAYALLYEDDRMEIWLLSWLPHHSTGFHDHGESSVGFCVAQGALTEQHLRFAEPPQAQTLVVGEGRAAGSDYIHCLEWEIGEPALSVHIYSPPLAVVGQYRHDDDGVLRRQSQPGRDELTKD